MLYSLSLPLFRLIEPFKIYNMFLNRLFVLLFAAIVVCLAPEVSLSQMKELNITPFSYSLEKDVVLPVEIGKISVPESHDKPGGKIIEIKFIRLKCTGSIAETPLFYFAGGPGSSGIAALKSEKLNAFLELRKKRDVILIDQRGTGITTPVLTSAKKLELPLNKSLGDQASLNAYVDQVGNFIAESKKSGVDLNAYNTLESAADMEDIRKAFGMNKIIIWGHSYGTHLGLAYIKYFGDHVEKAILQGINGLDQRFRLPSDINLVFDEIDAIISTQPILRKAIPSFPELVKQELKKLEVPISVKTNIDNKPVEITLGRLDMEAAIIANIGSTSFIRELPSLMFQMSKGNYMRAAQLAYGIKTFPLGTPMSFSMHFASGCSPGRMMEIQKDLPNGILGNAINFPYIFEGLKEKCNINELDSTFRREVVSKIPVLFMSATLDGRTSLADARIIKQGFSNSVWAVFSNCSHDFTSPQFIETISDYLNGTLVNDTKVVNADFDFYELSGNESQSRIYNIITKEGVPAFIDQFKLNKNLVYLSNTSLIPIAIRLMREQKVELAAELLSANPKLFGKENWQVLNYLADAYVILGKQNEAIDVYKSALQLNPGNFTALVRLIKLNQYAVK